MAATRVLSLAAVGLLAASAQAAPGRVVSVTATRAYLDKGTADGVALGASLTLTRDGEAAGRCVVEEVSEGNARCKGAGLRVGDRFKVSVERAPKVAAPDAPPPLTTAEELASRNATLVAAPVGKVAYTGPVTGGGAPAGGLRLHGELGWTHTSWVSTGGAGFHDERVDLAIRGLEIWRGLRVWADATLVQFEARPDHARYRPGTGTMLFVRELALARREVGSPFAFAVGRVRPWHAPGVMVLDGAQAGWRSASGLAEVGVLGGELPDVRSIGFQKAWLAGLYWAVEHRGEKDATVRVLRHEARLAALEGPAFERRYEAQALLQASLGRVFDAGLDAKAAYTGAGGAALDGLRLDLGARPVGSVRIFGGYRYEGMHDPELAAVDPGYRGVGHRADAAATWDVRPSLTLGVSGGYSRDGEGAAGLERGWVGPQIGFPTLFGARGGVTVGYGEELGWLSGRNAYVQAAILPAARWRLLVRGSYYHDDYGAKAVSTDEVGLGFNLDAPLVSWLSLRASAAGRIGLQATEADPPYGFVGSLGLRGAL